MPKAHKPRSGSMQFWPRKRAKKAYAKIRSWAKVDGIKLLGFAGYKGLDWRGLTGSQSLELDHWIQIIMWIG